MQSIFYCAFYCILFFANLASSLVADGIQTSVAYTSSQPDTLALDGDQYLIAYQNGNVYIARYDRYTNLGTFTMNINPSSAYPDIDRLNTTHIVGVWIGSGGVRGRVCPADGCTDSTEFQADNGTVSIDFPPKVAKLGNVTANTNKFLVAWKEGSNTVVIRTFSFDGTALTPATYFSTSLYWQFDVTSVYSGTEWTWVVAYDNSYYLTPASRIVYANGTWSGDAFASAGGSYVSISSSIGHPNNLWGMSYTSGGHVKVQIFYPNGATYSDPGIINFGTQWNQNPSKIAGMSSGKFAVVWTSYDQDGDGSGIYGNIIYPNGSRYYTEDLQIADNTAGWQQNAAVTGFSSGSGANQFVPVWEESALLQFKIVNIPSPSPSPSPSRTPSASPSVTPSPSMTPTSSVTPSTSVTPSRTPSVTPTPSKSPSVTPSPSPTMTPNASPSTTPSMTPSTSVSPSVTPTSSPSVTPSTSPTASVTSTVTPTTSSSPSKTPSQTPSNSQSPTPSTTSTATTTPSITPTLDAAVSAQNKKSNTSVIAGVAGGVGGSASLVICAAGFIFIRRKRKNKDSSEEQGQPKDIELKPASPQTPMTLASLENDKGWRIDMKDIDMNEELGRGAFGVVFKCIWRNTDCVVKLLNISQTNEAAINAFMREAHNVKNLRNHPNVCSILGVCPDPVGIVMEYVPGGSLLHCIANKKIVMTPKKVISFAKDIASGMSHLHAENIIHLDLACRNLLVSFGANDEQHVKITDFGLSRIMEAETYTASSDATFPLRWTAPETLTMRMVSRASDVWSFAVTIWEMIERKIPYMDLPSSQVVEFVTSGKRLSRPSKVEIPDALWELMIVCWSEAPADRPTFEQICTQLRKIEEQFKENELKKSKEDSQGHNGTFFTGSGSLLVEDEKTKKPQSSPVQPIGAVSVESTYGNATTSTNTSSMDNNSADSSLAPYTKIQQAQQQDQLYHSGVYATESAYGNVSLPPSTNNSMMDNNTSAPYKPIQTQPAEEQQTVAATQAPYGNKIQH